MILIAPASTALLASTPPWDPAEDDRVATEPLGDPAWWITPADYPNEAGRAVASGTVSVVYVIGTDGRVSGCRTVASSGNEALDRQTCVLIIRRGRFKPAFGKDGRPMERHQLYRATWEKP